ncbi:MAG: hypothetical protein C4576_27565 [Desulfobacteraceae bacterium]|nr:MAG: hypothetical protein C4576_27565 [Desulfobacteraceae bacterium]
MVRMNMKPATGLGFRVSALFLLLSALVLGPGTAREGFSGNEEQGPGGKVSATPQFAFPKLAPDHEHMRLLLENAFRYVDPAHGVIDRNSGYPAEGWNPSLRAFTQLTAIGMWVELLSNIAAGYAENPFISKESALSRLSTLLGSLRADQEDPSLSAKGLLVNFLSIHGPKRSGPLQESIERRRFLDVFGEKKGGAIWQALVEKGWIRSEGKGQRGTIRRGEGYGAAHFDGKLAAFSEEPLRSLIMEVLDRRIVLVIFGDNVNLTASLAKSVGALLKPEIRDDPQVSRLRDEMEGFIENQKSGYEHLYDPKTGTFYFGWNATTDRMVGWDDGRGNWIEGRMNYLINEFRGPWIFTTLRHGLPEAAIRNAGFKIKPYRRRDGTDLHVLAAWEGSAFQLLGLSLFMQENRNPGWSRNLQNLVDAEVDYSERNGLPGFLSESYSGNSAEYTGYIGIQDLAVTDKPLITNAPSLYTLGVAYMVAPEKIERFLKSRWPLISGLLTPHGPWEGYNTSTCEPIEYQTTAHTLSLVLCAIGSAHENMNRYLTLKGMTGRLEDLYRPGVHLDFLSQWNQVSPWAEGQVSVTFEKRGGGYRFRFPPAARSGVRFVIHGEHGANLSNGTLRIRYRSDKKVDALFTVRRSEKDPLPTPSIPTEIFTRFEATGGREKEIAIILPATPALSGIKEASLLFETAGEETPLDMFIAGLEFQPFTSALTPPTLLPFSNKISSFQFYR